MLSLWLLFTKPTAALTKTRSQPHSQLAPSHVLCSCVYGSLSSNTTLTFTIPINHTRLFNKNNFSFSHTNRRLQRTVAVAPNEYHKANKYCVSSPVIETIGIGTRLWFRFGSVREPTNSKPLYDAFCFCQVTVLIINNNQQLEKRLKVAFSSKASVR